MDKLCPKLDTLLVVQAAGIPKALEGKDLIARARTGSGKTLAYLLPALHKILAAQPAQQRAGWQALVLVPTRELCEQVGELLIPWLVQATLMESHENATGQIAVRFGGKQQG